jgi:hypothetical protein
MRLPFLVRIARWAEGLFAIISLLLWLSLPFPPGSENLLTSLRCSGSAIAGIVLVFWLPRRVLAPWRLAIAVAGVNLPFAVYGLITRASYISSGSPSTALAYCILLSMAVLQGLVLAICILGRQYWDSDQDIAQALAREL